MAKAGAKSSTIDWIPVWEVYQKAVLCFLTPELADMRLREWMATGQLPWKADSFEGPNADDVARLHREDSESIVMHILPSAAYHNGDPQFWRANPTAWWGKNAAREFSAFGARAMGIRVSRAHSDELLLRAGEPAESKKTPPEWLDWARKEYPQQRNEQPTAYIRRLHGLMQDADNVTKAWTFGNFRRRYYEQAKTNR